VSCHWRSVVTFLEMNEPTRIAIIRATVAVMKQFKYDMNVQNAGMDLIHALGASAISTMAYIAAGRMELEELIAAYPLDQYQRLASMPWLSEAERLATMTMYNQVRAASGFVRRGLHTVGLARGSMA